MQSSARGGDSEYSSSSPTLADAQAEYFTDREAEPAGWRTERRLNRWGPWLNHFLGRSGPRAGGHSEAETDPLLEFALEPQTTHDSFEPARTAPSRTRSGVVGMLLALGIIVVVTGVGAIAANQFHVIRIPGFAVQDGRLSIQTRQPVAPAAADWEGDSRPHAEVPATPAIYTTGDDGVLPPVVIDQRLPSVPRDLQRMLRAATGLLELLVDQTGAVQAAAIRRPISPGYDKLLLDASRRWRYRPATKDGAPVTFRKLILLRTVP